MEVDDRSRRTVERPLLSIVVPVFNTSKFILRCVASILDQRLEDLELILIDDGSSDGSSEICDAIAERDSRVLCLHQPNGGVSSARNVGMEVARGKYLWFCDSDDIVKEGALETLFDCLHDNSPAMVAFPVEQVDEDGNVLGLIPCPKPSKSPELGPLQCGDLLYPYAHVFLRELARDEWFDTSLVLLEDRDFLYRMFWKAAGSVAVIERPLYRYTITRGDSAVNSSSVSKYVDAAKVQTRILDNEISLGYPMPAFEQCATYFVGVLSKIVRKGSRPGDYEFMRGELLKYRRYLSLLGDGLKLKCWLIVYFPAVFNALTKAYGVLKTSKSNKPGSSVLVKG